MCNRETYRDKLQVALLYSGPELQTVADQGNAQHQERGCATQSLQKAEDHVKVCSTAVLHFQLNGVLLLAKITLVMVG